MGLDHGTGPWEWAMGLDHGTGAMVAFMTIALSNHFKEKANFLSTGVYDPD